MTDEMMVQGQRPSATPYVLGGAALGGVGGWGATKLGCGINSKYSNWEDAINDATKNDEFVSKKIEKSEGDVKSAWQSLKDEAQKVADAEKAVTDYKLPEGVNAEDFKDFIEKQDAFAKADEALKSKKKVEFDRVFNLLKGKEFEAGSTIDVLGESYTPEKFKELLNSANEADKAKVKSFIEQHSDYTTAINAEDFAKTEKATLANAQTALDEATSALKNKSDKIDDTVIAKVKELRKGVTDAKANAEKVLTEDLLSKCKKPSVAKTAAVGALALAALGYLLRPKAKETV